MDKPPEFIWVDHTAEAFTDDERISHGLTKYRLDTPPINQDRALEAWTMIKNNIAHVGNHPDMKDFLRRMKLYYPIMDAALQQPAPMGVDETDVQRHERLISAPVPEGYPANWHRDSSLKTWFPFSYEELERLKAENRLLKLYPCQEQPDLRTETDQQTKGLKMNDEQIKHMVNRFLGWKLPEDFRPDCGIQFDAYAAQKLNPQNHKYQPNGTNLFDYNQAEKMVRFMIEGIPAAPGASEG